MPEVRQPIMMLLGEGKVWVTPSKSNPAATHVTILNKNGIVSCTCHGYRYRRTCWHVTSVTPNPEEADIQVNL